VEGVLLESGSVGSAEDEGSLVVLTQVVEGRLRLFNGVETSHVELSAVSVVGTGDSCVDRVQTQHLDFQVSGAWPVGELVFNGIAGSL